MTKEEIIRSLESRILDQNEYLEKGIYGDKAWGAKEAYKNALELVKNLTIPVVVKSLDCDLCGNTEGLDDISVCNNCWDRVNNH